MNHKPSSSQKGFGLIEVLIALVVLSVGMLAISSLQVEYLSSGNEAKLRSVATKVAQEKLNDLRTFAQLEAGAAGTFGYEEIGGNTGGLENDDGTLINQSGTVETPQQNFTRNWTVTNYYYPPTGAQAVIASDWDSDTWGTIPERPHFKAVSITVAWTDRDGETQTITTSGAIAASDPEASGRTHKPSDDNDDPTVIYTPGEKPEIVAVDIDSDGTKKESSLPDPQVSQNAAFVVTKFDEVVYDTVLKTQERTGFTTVNCECNYDGSASAYQPAIRDLNGWNVYETQVTKNTGSRITTGQAGQQSVYCDTCCRDHHSRVDDSDSDAEDNVAQFDSFRPADTTNYPTALDGDHSHMYPDGDGVLQTANSTGDTYLEACRMIRIDGYQRVSKDWTLEKLVIMPSTWLATESNYNSYVEYVKDFVAAYIDAIPGTASCVTDTGEYKYGSMYTDTDNKTGQVYEYIMTNDTTVIDSSATPWETSYVSTFGNYSRPTSLSFTTSFVEPAQVDLDISQQEALIARAIYLDRIEPRLLNEIKCRKASGDDYLYLVPFHEVNVKKLANWGSDDPSRVTVTDEPIEDGATHSRGVVTAVDTGTVTVTASIERSNTGLTDTNSIDSDDDATSNIVSDTISIRVQTGSTDSGAIRITGTIAIGGGAGVNASDVTVTGSNGAACSKITDETFTCELDGSGSGDVVISGYTTLKTTGSTSSAVNNTSCPTDPSGLDVDSIAVTNDGAVSGFNSSLVDETTTYTFTNETADTTLNIIIKKEGQSC